jgi:hypothetical protein
MTDDEIEELVRELIEENLDKETRKAALEWLENAPSPTRPCRGSAF